MSKKGISVKVDKQDLKALTSKLENFEAFNKMVDLRLRVNAQTTANEAARNTPVNDSNLRLSIRAAKQKKSVYEVIVGAVYGMYVEWGTRHKFSKSNLKDMRALGIPDSYAEQFKATPLKRATNLKARPYFFPAVRKNWEKTLKVLAKDIKNIIKKKG